MSPLNSSLCCVWVRDREGTCHWYRRHLSSSLNVLVTYFFNISHSCQVSPFEGVCQLIRLRSSAILFIRLRSLFVDKATVACPFPQGFGLRLLTRLRSLGACLCGCAYLFMRVLMLSLWWLLRAFLFDSFVLCYLLRLANDPCNIDSTIVEWCVTHIHYTFVCWSVAACVKFSFFVVWFLSCWYVRVHVIVSSSPWNSNIHVHSIVHLLSAVRSDLRIELRGSDHAPLCMFAV